jgi:hypothetical protein
VTLEAVVPVRRHALSDGPQQSMQTRRVPGQS